MTRRTVSATATAQLSPGVHADSTVKKPGEQLNFNHEVPQFKGRDVSKMKKAELDDQGLTWGPTAKGISVSHN